MAKRSEHTVVLEGISPDRAVEILASEEFELEQQASQEGNKSCDVVPKSRDEKRIVYELHTVEYAKGIRGLDRSKTINTTTVVIWDLEKRTSEWTYSGPHDKRVRVWGGTTITPQGDGCRIRTRLEVEIKIPLVGGKIEDLVIRGTDKHWPAYERILRKNA